MKKKSFEKKLSFSKVTVANLEENLMSTAKGGIIIKPSVKCTTDITPDPYTCPDTFNCTDPDCNSYVECPTTEWIDCTIGVC